MAEYQRAAPAPEPLPPARALVNRFLLSRVGSVFAAGPPELDATTRRWRVPILYNPPDFAAGEIGEGRVNATTGDMEQHTPVAEIRRRAAKLNGHFQAQIHTAFLRTRKK